MTTPHTTPATITRNGSGPLVSCGVCGQPTRSKYGVCKRNVVCKQAWWSIRRRGEIRAIRVLVKCQICDTPTRSRLGICQKTPACHAAYNNVLYQEQPARGIGVSRQWQLRNPKKSMLIRVRFRAKKTGIPFSLCENDIQIPEFCPVLGVKLEFSTAGNAPNTPSIDRLIPRLGYVTDNIQIISYKANVMKHNATPEELRRFSRFFLNFGLEN
jgi:hypothetical protein